MDNNVLFINVGRGTIVDEEVLINVLKRSINQTCLFRCFENEPLSKDNPLYDLDNDHITAHITGNDSNNNREATDIFKKNLEHFLNNYDVIENKVDLDYSLLIENSKLLTFIYSNSYINIK